MDEAALKLIHEAREAGTQHGLRLAIGVVEAWLAKLIDPEFSKGVDCIEARRDQLEKVLKTLIESRQ